MSFVEVARLRDIPADGMTAVEAGGKEIVLIGHDGGVYALDRRCPHMGGDLAAGILKDGRLTCPRHGSTFDVTTGRCLQGPHIVFLKLKGTDSRSYPVRIDEERVLIDVG